jgi:hypothetical protein
MVLDGGFGTRTADGSQSPEANPDARGSAAHSLQSCILSSGKIDPMKINRGRRLDEQARGPDRSEMIDHPPREQTCEGRYEPQERRRTTRGKDQSFGQAAKARSW